MTTAGDGSGATILVVDDDPSILAMLESRLSKRGYNIVTAADGAAALEQARAHNPAVIILDVMMPKMSGWEVARTIKQDEDTKAIKIVMLTAIGEDVNEMTSPLYGADAHIDKPFDFTVLESTIADLLE